MKFHGNHAQLFLQCFVAEKLPMKPTLYGQLWAHPAVRSPSFHQPRLKVMIVLRWTLAVKLRFYESCRTPHCVFVKVDESAQGISGVPQLLSICGCFKQWLPSAAVRSATAEHKNRRQCVRLAVKWRDCVFKNVWYLQDSHLYVALIIASWFNHKIHRS